MKQKLLLIALLLSLPFGPSRNIFAQSADPLKPLKTAFQSQHFTLSGYGHILYETTDRPSPGLSNSSLDISRIILSATGTLGSRQQFAYMLMYDLGPNARLQELYGEWRPSTALYLRAGQYKIPFTIENPMSLARLETIRTSRPASAMSGSTGDANQFDIDGLPIGAKAGRDLGFQLSGRLFQKNDFYRIEYYTGLFNGAGLNTRDNDNHKDFLASAYWQPLRGLRLGGSLYNGQLYQQPRNRRALSAEYTGSRLYARAEYIDAADGPLRRNGYYASLVWKTLPDRLACVAKYDFYNNDTALPDNGIRDFTLGLNYYFAPLSRIQLNYILFDNLAAGKSNTLLAQIQVGF